MKIFAISFLVLLLLIACNAPNQYEERLDGHSAKNPTINFSKHFLKDFPNIGKYRVFRNIDTLHSTDSILVTAAEYHRSDGKPAPLEGSRLYITIKTSQGDKEVLNLGSDRSFLQWPDNVILYSTFVNHQFNSNEQFKKRNGMIEFVSENEKIIAEYSSYWHGHIVRDTLIYFRN